MAQPIVIKRSAVRGKVPLLTDLDLGEIALNTADGRMYLRNTATNSIVKVRNSADLMAGNIILSASPNYTTPSFVPANGASYAYGTYPKLDVLYGASGPSWSGAVKLSDPPYGQIQGEGFGAAWSSDSLYLSVASSGNPSTTAGSVAFFKRTFDTFEAYPLNTYPGVACYATAFPPSGDHVAFGGDNGVHVYKNDGTTFKKLTISSLIFSSSVLGLSYSNDGQYLAVASNGNPGLRIYKRSEDTYTFVSGIPGIQINARSVCFSQDSTYLAVTYSSDPYLDIYKISSGVFSKLTGPATRPPSNTLCSTFSFDGKFLAVGYNSGKCLTIYKRTDDTFTALADPVNLVSAITAGVSFTPDGKYLVQALMVASPYVVFYSISEDVFTKASDPAVIPLSNSRSVAFSPNGGYLALSNQSGPRVTLYKPSSGSNLAVPTYTSSDARLKYYICTGQ